MRRLVSLSFVLLLLASVCVSIHGQEDRTNSASSDRTPLLSLPPRVLEIKLEAADGSSFTLGDYSGKVLVVNFWASWAGPSRLETPELVKLHGQFRKQKVEIIGLTTENPEASRTQILNWIRDFKVPYRIGWAPAEVLTILMQGQDVVPQTFVISRTGRIVRRFIGFNPASSSSQFKRAIKRALSDGAKR